MKPNLSEPIKNVAYYRIILYLLRYGRPATITEIKRGRPPNKEERIPPPPRKPDNHHKRYEQAVELLLRNRLITQQRNPQHRGSRLLTLKPDDLAYFRALLPNPLLDAFERNITGWSKKYPSWTGFELLTELRKIDGLASALDLNINRDTLCAMMDREEADLDRFKNSYRHVETVTLNPPKSLKKERPAKRLDRLLKPFKQGRIPETPRLQPLTELVLYIVKMRDGDGLYKALRWRYAAHPFNHSRKDVGIDFGISPRELARVVNILENRI